MSTIERTNADWLADLQSGGARRAQALDDLRQLLERGVYFYLRNERSDLDSRATEEIRQMSQDFVQEALIKILDNLDSFRGESQFTTWASKIAARVAISELRRARYRDYSLEYLTSDGETIPVMGSLAAKLDTTPQPERHTERQAVFQIIDEAFRTALTERQRLVMTAYVIDEVPIEEIARRLGTNRNALYKLVHDARLKLRRYLEAQELSLDYMLGLFGNP